MKFKLPALYVVVLVVICVGIAVYFVLFQAKDNVIMVVYGAGISTLMALLGYFLTLWSLDKSNKKFAWAVLGGGALRIAILFGAICLAFLYSKTGFLAFVIALLAAYVLFLFAEIIVLSRLKPGKSEK